VAESGGTAAEAAKAAAELAGHNGEGRSRGGGRGRGSASNTTTHAQLSARSRFHIFHGIKTDF